MCRYRLGTTAKLIAVGLLEPAAFWWAAGRELAALATGGERTAVAEILADLATAHGRQLRAAQYDTFRWSRARAGPDLVDLDIAGLTAVSIRVLRRLGRRPWDLDADFGALPPLARISLTVGLLLADDEAPGGGAGPRPGGPEPPPGARSRSRRDRARTGVTEVPIPGAQIRQAVALLRGYIKTLEFVNLSDEPPPDKLMALYKALIPVWPHVQDNFIEILLPRLSMPLPANPAVLTPNHPPVTYRVIAEYGHPIADMLEQIAADLEQHQHYSTDGGRRPHTVTVPVEGRRTGRAHRAAE